MTGERGRGRGRGITVDSFFSTMRSWRSARSVCASSTTGTGSDALFAPPPATSPTPFPSVGIVEEEGEREEGERVFLGETMYRTKALRSAYLWGGERECVRMG